MLKDDLDVFDSSSEEEEISTTSGKRKQLANPKKPTRTEPLVSESKSKEGIKIVSVKLRKSEKKKKATNRRKPISVESDDDSDDDDFGINQDMSAKKAGHYFSSLDYITNKYCRSKSRVVNLDKLDRKSSSGRSKLSYYDKVDHDDESDDESDLEDASESESIISSSENECDSSEESIEDLVESLQEDEPNRSFDLDNCLAKNYRSRPFRSLPNFSSDFLPISSVKRKHESMNSPPRCSTPLPNEESHVKKQRSSKDTPINLAPSIVDNNNLLQTQSNMNLNVNVFNIQFSQHNARFMQFNTVDLKREKTEEEFNDNQIRDVFENIISYRNRNHPF